MIICERDQLTIKHEEGSSRIKEVLSERAARYIEDWLPRLLTQNPNHALEKLLLKEFARLSPTQQAEARKAVAAATPERIEARFRKLVDEEVAGHSALTPTAQLSFQRTLRIPDDGKTYPLPPGLGRFPVSKLEPYADKLPQAWSALGGVLIPVYQAEAMWLQFSSQWPTALKIGTGTVNAINGQKWTPGLSTDPQGYVVLPEQPWLDGFCVAPGIVRQFIAARHGDGYTAEEQVLGSTRGGLQFEAYPVRPEAYFEKKLSEKLPRSVDAIIRDLLCDSFPHLNNNGTLRSRSFDDIGIGIGAGGRIKQEIYKDQWEPEDWDLNRPSRLWVHLVEAAIWQALTGKPRPQKPPTASEYAACGLPWFEYYRDDMEALSGSESLARLKSVYELAEKKGDSSVPPDESPGSLPVVPLGPDAPTNQVSQWDGK